MFQFKIDPRIVKVAPQYTGLAIECEILNTPSDKALWHEMEQFITTFAATHAVADVKGIDTILTTRAAYKALGKDPNRYRPSAESLRRRIAKEKALYKIDTLVDLINYVSMKTGYSIGGFDADKIEGKELTLGVGEAGESFCGIGRGLLNIEGLPVYRDEKGGIGTPTSDEERTKVSLDTIHTVIIINGYAGIEGLCDAGKMTVELLERYLQAKNISVTIYNSEGVLS